MVCGRCKLAVQTAIDKAGLHATHIELGEVELAEDPPQPTLEQLDADLQQLGFEIIDDRKSRIIGQIKTAIIDLVHYQQGQPDVNLSTYLADHLNYDYGYLSNLFSEVEATTIEKYYIAQRIEKVKELILYDELSLSQIALQMGYSSAAYLSAQFKKQTGLTPSFYKTMKENKRRNLDEL